jgi:hypothetical protein
MKMSNASGRDDSIDPRMPEPEAPSDGEIATAEAPRERGKYVYCVIETDQEEEFGDIGIGEGSSRVFTVHHGDLAAVVSDTPGVRGATDGHS